MFGIGGKMNNSHYQTEKKNREIKVEDEYQSVSMKANLSPYKSQTEHEEHLYRRVLFGGLLSKVG